MSTDFVQLTVQDVLNRVQAGELTIPTFQRGVVWGVTRAAMLLDSMMRGYPVGAITAWSQRTDGPAGEPITSAHTAAPPRLSGTSLFIVDGQQRLTALHAVATADHDALDQNTTGVYYLMKNRSGTAGGRIVAESNGTTVQNRQQNEVNLSRIPLQNILSEAEFLKVYKILSKREASEIRDVRERLINYQLPFIVIRQGRRQAVSEAFGRINNQGKQVSTVDLLSARLADGETSGADIMTALQQRFNVAQETPSNACLTNMYRILAFTMSGKADEHLLHDAKPGRIRDHLPELASAYAHSRQYLAETLHVYRTQDLPHSRMIVPLATYFHRTTATAATVPHDHNEAIKQWFWQSCFSENHSQDSKVQISRDINYLKKIANGKTMRQPQPGSALTAKRFLVTRATSRGKSSFAKAFYLLLSTNDPRSFVTGEPVLLPETDAELGNFNVHHILPNSYLKDFPKVKGNCPANYALCGVADNAALGGDSPNEYRELMPQDDNRLQAVLDSAFCPDSIWANDPQQFLNDRAALLAEHGNKLMGFPPASS